MSWTSKLKFWGKQKVLQRQELEKVGLNVYADGKFDNRLEAKVKLYEKLREVIPKTHVANGKVEESPISERLVLLEGKLQDINDGLQVIAIPFMRAATKHEYSEIIQGWSGLYHISKDICATVREIISEKQEKIDQVEIFNLFEEYLNVDVFLYAQLIDGISYSDQDVAPSHAEVIQSMQFPGAGGGAPPKQDDKITDDMWASYYQQMDFRLKQLEAKKS